MHRTVVAVLCGRPIGLPSVYNPWAGRHTCVVVRLFHCLLVVSSVLSLPPQHHDGDPDGNSVVVSLDGGHFNHPVRSRRPVWVEGLDERLLDGFVDHELYM